MCLIPVTNTSVNPARSTGVALYVGGWAIKQLWLFWVAPIIGTIIGGAVYRFIGRAFDTGWTGRYYVNDVSIFTISAIPAVASRVNDWLSLGASANIL